MAAITDFLPYVLPYVAGCPSPLAEQYIRDVCIDFCTYSLIAQEAHLPVSARQGVDTYSFTPPQGMEVLMIMRAWYEKAPIAVFNLDSPAMRPEMISTRFLGANTNGGTPRALKMDNTKTFTLNVAPATDSAAAITMQVALKPTRTATTVPDILFNYYAYEIGQGVIARLYQMPGQEFTNPAIAAAPMATYLMARSNGRVQANRAFGRTQARINNVRF